MTLPTALWAHIYSFTGAPAKTALVSREHRHATYQALYNELFGSPVDSILRKVGEEFGRWQNKDPDGSIQRWLRAREKAITYIQVRAPHLDDKEWKAIHIDPFHPFYWHLRDIQQAGNALQKKREDRLVDFFKQEIQALGFDPLLELAEDLSHPNKVAQTRAWLETHGTKIVFNRREASSFKFPPFELASMKLTADVLEDLFTSACYAGDYEFLQATLAMPSRLEHLSRENAFLHPVLRFYEKYPTIGQEILTIPDLKAHLESARSLILDIAAREGHSAVLHSFQDPELDKATILEKACYAGQSEIVKRLLNTHPFSNAQLSWSLFVTLEGPCVVTYSLPLPFVYLLSQYSAFPMLYVLLYPGIACFPFIIYNRFFPPEPRPGDLNGATIPSPVQISMLRPLKASYYLCGVSIPIGLWIQVAIPVFQDDQLPTSSKTWRLLSGIGISLIGGTLVLLLTRMAQLETPKRSFSVLGGFYSAVRETAIGRMQVIRDLSCALLKKIPCRRRWEKEK